MKKADALDGVVSLRRVDKALKTARDVFDQFQAETNRAKAQRLLSSLKSALDGAARNVAMLGNTDEYA